MSIEALQQLAQMQNALSAIKPDAAATLGKTCLEEYRIDLASRAEWEDCARAALKQVLQEAEAKTYPFKKASNVQYPLLTTASLQFAARAYPAIVQPPRLVKTQILGRDRDSSKRARGERVSDYLSYQLMHDMAEWESETDTLLQQIPIVGCAFRKVIWLAESRRPLSMMVPAFDLVVHQSTVSLETVPRLTHRYTLYPQEIASRKRSGVFLDEDYGTAGDADERQDRDPSDTLAPHTFLEQHTYVDLDGDGYPEPWVVTIHEPSEKIVSVQFNGDLRKATIAEDGTIIKIPRYQTFVKYSFLPDPEGGFYDIGFGRLLKSLTASIDSTLNQMLDAGHLQNAGGGFIGSGLNLKKQELRFEPGRYHYVNTAGQDIRNALVTMQHPGPSPALMNLLQMLIESGKQITAVQDIMTGDVGRSQPATTTLAQIEQGLKVFSSIYKRVYRALAQEYKILYDINGQYPDEDAYRRVLDFEDPQPQADPMQGQQPQMLPAPQPPISMAEDFAYDDCDILPVADPNVVTDMQRMARAQFILELAGHPVLGQQFNPRTVAERVLSAAHIDDTENLLQQQQGEDPAMRAQAELAQADVNLKRAQEQKLMAEVQQIMTQMSQGPDNGSAQELQLKAERQQAELELKAQAQDFEARRKAAELEIKADQASAKHSIDVSKLELSAEQQALKARNDMAITSQKLRAMETERDLRAKNAQSSSENDRR